MRSVKTQTLRETLALSPLRPHSQIPQETLNLRGGWSAQKDSLPTPTMTRVTGCDGTDQRQPSLWNDMWNRFLFSW